MSFDPDAYLDSLEPVGWRLGLERMHRLTTALGLPQRRFASIHVVGTNGKSSVTRMAAALLEAHGVASGACLSPHAARWTERTLIRGEEIWSYHPARDGHLAVHAFPVADEALRDEPAEEDVETGIRLTQRLRAWRDLAGVPVAATLAAVVDGVEPPEFVGRLSRFAFDGVGADPVASVGPVRVLASEALDAEAVAARLRKRREELEAEVRRASRKLENEGFVAKAPAEVVEEERGKLERYRQELAELG